MQLVSVQSEQAVNMQHFISAFPKECVKLSDVPSHFPALRDFLHFFAGEIRQKQEKTAS